MSVVNESLPLILREGMSDRTNDKVAYEALYIKHNVSSIGLQLPCSISTPSPLVLFAAQT